MTEAFVGQLGYLGIALLLVLGGLGLPVPEEAPIILAGILSKGGRLWWPLALGACLGGVLLGDFIVYLLGYIYGEKVMSLRLTRKFLTRARETQIKGYFHRHGFKILILGRFAVGFRTAAYLTAGILKLPALRLFLTDLFAASLSTVLTFGLGYVFAHQIQNTLDRAKYWLTAAAAVAVGALLLLRYYKARQRAGLLVGPKILESADLPLPPDDLHASHPGTPRAVPPAATPPAAPAVAPSPLPQPAPRPAPTSAPVPIAAPEHTATEHAGRNGSAAHGVGDMRPKAPVAVAPEGPTGPEPTRP